MASPVHVFAPFGKALRPQMERFFPGRPVVCWSSAEEFAAGIGTVEYLLALDPPRQYWDRAVRLRLIQCLGAGVDGVLPAPDLPPSVRVANNRGNSAPSMAEFALALILALLKRLPGAMAAQREHRWQRFLPQTLEGRTLGILGLGAIGQALAQRARALGMRVIATQRTPKPHAQVERIHPPEGTGQVVAEADILVILLPLTPETRGLLSASLLEAMKPGAYVVDLARGGILDEAALCRCLESGALAGAALDVFAQEPLPPESSLWEAPNLLLTPHVAGAFPELLERALAAFAENVARLERGEEIRNAVDRARGY